MAHKDLGTELIKASTSGWRLFEKPGWLFSCLSRNIRVMMKTQITIIVSCTSIFLLFILVSCTTQSHETTRDTQGNTSTFNELILNKSPEPIALIRLENGQIISAPVSSINEQGVTLDESSVMIRDNRFVHYSWDDIIELPQWLFISHREQVLLKSKECHLKSAQLKYNESVLLSSYVFSNKAYLTESEYKTFAEFWNDSSRKAQRRKIFNAVSNALLYMDSTKLDAHVKAASLSCYVVSNKACLTESEYEDFLIKWNISARNEMRRRLFGSISNALWCINTSNLPSAMISYEYIQNNRQHLQTNELNDFEMKWDQANQVLRKQMRLQLFSSISNALWHVNTSNLPSAMISYKYIHNNRHYLQTNELNDFELRWFQACNILRSNEESKRQQDLASQRALMSQAEKEIRNGNDNQVADALNTILSEFPQSSEAQTVLGLIRIGRQKGDTQYEGSVSSCTQSDVQSIKKSFDNMEMMAKNYYSLPDHKRQAIDNILIVS